MSCTVRDASLVTKNNRNKAVNAYYTSWKDATMNTPSSNPSLVNGPAGAGAEVVAQIKLGCEQCVKLTNFLNNTPDGNMTLYPFNPSSGGAGRNGPS